MILPHSKQPKQCPLKEKLAMNAFLPKAAVQMAMNSLAPALAEYVRTTFPLRAKIIKIVNANNGKAETILIKCGKKHGVKGGKLVYKMK